MLNIATKKAAIRVWLVNAMSITVVFAKQGAPIPDRPCAILAILSVRKFGQDHKTKITVVDDEGTREIIGTRLIMCSVNVYGADALENAEKAISALEMFSVQQDLKSADLAINPHTQINDLERVIDTKFEGRAQFDIQFATSSTTEEDMSWIETVGMTEEYVAVEGGEVVLERTYTIDVE